ncbi:MAG TPA: DUF2007 domain-containing protein [Atribacteraceae bacterium]|nr:DUF2007 domain-containing protein [Atribacteraceae bacterium]
MKYRSIITVSHRMEAELIKGHLEAEGVLVLLRPSTEPYGGEAFFGDAGPLEILVPEDQAERASSVINDVLGATSEDEDDHAEI